MPVFNAGEARAAPACFTRLHTVQRRFFKRPIPARFGKQSTIPRIQPEGGAALRFGPCEALVRRLLVADRFQLFLA